MNIANTGSLETPLGGVEHLADGCRIVTEERRTSAQFNSSVPIEVSHFDGAISKWGMPPRCRTGVGNHSETSSGQGRPKAGAADPLRRRQELRAHSHNRGGRTPGGRPGSASRRPWIRFRPPSPMFRAVRGGPQKMTPAHEVRPRNSDSPNRGRRPRPPGRGGGEAAALGTRDLGFGGPVQVRIRWACARIRWDSVGRPGLDPGTLGLKVPCSSG